VPDPAQVRQHLEKTVASKAIGKKVGDSDDSDNLVIGRPTGRNRKRQDLYASGGVAKGDKPGAYPTRAQRARNIREDTEEVLRRRSRSASCGASRRSTSAPATALSPNGKESAKGKAGETAVRTTDSSKKKNNARGVEETANSVSHTPQAENSVLGRIKPRKRQASLLRLIEQDGNDDSTLLSRDEAEFLPDVVSSPVAEKRSAPPTGSSLKRKRGPEIPDYMQNGQLTSPSNAVEQQQSSVLRSSPEIPHPTRSQKRKLSTNDTRPRALEEDSVMAMPESSDSEASVDDNEQPQRPISPNTRRKQPLAPSTQQLQSLMPSKRHKLIRQRQAKDAFDIPEDSQPASDAVSDDDHEHSTFLPARNRKLQNKVPTKSRIGQSSNKSTGTKEKKRPNVKDKTKSTNKTTTTAFTPSPVRVRTPIPLSSSTKRNTRNTQAKSPSKQGATVMRDKTTNAVNTPLAAGNGKGKKQYGGSRLRTIGKENQVIASSDGLSGNIGLDNRDTIEVNKNAKSPSKTAKLNGYADAPEIKAWKKKWADIDDFEMEFEEVSMSTRSSSPMAR